MRSKPHPLLALAGAWLLAAALGACNFGRNVSDDCWVDQAGFDSANRYRAGLRARNLPSGDELWAVADARVDRARRALRACEDGKPGSGRPRVEDLSHGHAGGHEAAAGEHGAAAGGHGA